MQLLIEKGNCKVFKIIFCKTRKKCHRQGQFFLFIYRLHVIIGFLSFSSSLEDHFSRCYFSFFIAIVVEDALIISSL